ncbi:efflux RND transporter periplasmic adaptor subunit [Enterovibrio sp. 27052020O]
MKKWLIMLAIVAAMAAPVLYKLSDNLAKYEAFKNMPEAEFPVTVAEMVSTDWVPTIQAIGFIEPNQGVTLTSEVSGVIETINFESGQTVKTGDVLLALDSKVEVANLKSTQARLPAAEAKYKRYQGLFRKGSISKEALDEAEANFRSLQADVESLNASIDRRTIDAPFDGIVGLRNVFLGQYLQPGNEIVRLEDTSIMRLRFTVPQTDIAKIKLGQQIDISVDAYPDTPFTGKISAIEPAVNYQSGLIQVQADIPNNHGQLRSGMFARANIILPTFENQIVVAQTAINFTLYGENVYVLREEDGEMRAYQQVVKVGERKGHIAQVLDGLKAGDKVVTSGQVRLSNGAKVNVVESDALNPPAELPQL